jgi:predicted PurR-regulated permease PerM
VPEDSVQFSAPRWLRDLGFASWLLVGFVLIIVGAIWLLGQTSTIVMPVILAAVLGAVAGPAVGWLEHHRVPRIGGAILVLLGLVVIGVVVFLLVFGGISAQSGDIATKLNQALDKIQGWPADLGVDNAQQAADDVTKELPELRTTLLSGISTGISALSSLVCFLAFATLSTLFVLKDGPVMHRFINRHLGVPQPSRKRRHDQRREVAPQLLPRRYDHRRLQRRPHRRRGADPRRATRGDDRCCHLCGGQCPVRRRVGGRRLPPS